MIRKLLRAAQADLDTVRDRDPSILSRTEALLHPGLLAVWSYRVAHRIHVRGHRRTARLISNLARIATGGIEIHPGAEIGRRFFIDHGAGVVIGETVLIGDDVTIFHQVTLGSVGWWHDHAEGPRRHPTVGSNVVIGANATILGPVTVGSGSVVGAQALVVRDVPPGAKINAPVAGHRTAAVAGPRSVSGRVVRPATRAVALTRTPADAQQQPFPSW
jgi:serine O-acetyltransferase